MLPLFLNTQNKICLVVGGGAVASRKISVLRECGMSIRLVSPIVNKSLQTFIDDGEIEYRAGLFSESDLTGVDLVIAATSDRAVNKAIASDCEQQKILINVVDAPALSSVTFGALINRQPLQVAVSSGGASPVLTRLLRSKLEAYLPAAYGELAALVSNQRDNVKARISDAADRRYFWEEILQGAVGELTLSGLVDEAEKKMHEALDHWCNKTQQPGEVYLVGAGPGDPDLLTFRALRLMQQADVVVYDRLVSEPIIKLIRRGADMIYVGKKRADHTVPQEGINALLVRLAKEGKRVLRLKGGDPFIFGRGGEEIETLIAEGITFQVVPGITAASGCATYAGIPLTHRDYSQSCTFVTGNQKNGSVDLHWDALAKEGQTIVFYMGLSSVNIICEKLIAFGRDSETPAALIQQGTTPEQKVVIGKLSNLPERVAAEKIKAPTLIIVGEVVLLHDKLQWFHPRQPSVS